MQRKLVSLITFISFLGLIASSVVLYFVPEGRVAYWADWTFLELSKGQWSALHITGGLLFALAGLWHLLLNWKPIVAYMSKKAKENAKMPVPLILSFLITVFVYVGTLMNVQPMEQIMKWNERIKSNHAVTYGDPPYGHAELSSLEKFCVVVQIDVDAAVAYLQQNNLKGDIQKTSILLDVANENNMAPQEVYFLLRKSADADNPFGALPEAFPDGAGKRTIGDFCKQYGLSVDEVSRRLGDNGITATQDDTFSEIAVKHGLTGREVYSTLRAGKR